MPDCLKEFLEQLPTEDAQDVFEYLTNNSLAQQEMLVIAEASAA